MDKTSKLLTYREARRLSPAAFLYGFLLDNDGLLHCGNKVHPLSPDVKDLHRATVFQAQKIFDHLIKSCRGVYSGVDVASGYRERQQHMLLALVACTRPNSNQFLPDEETMTKLKEIMASNGFKQEPRWFVAA